MSSGDPLLIRDLRLRLYDISIDYENIHEQCLKDRIIHKFIQFNTSNEFILLGSKGIYFFIELSENNEDSFIVSFTKFDQNKKSGGYFKSWVDTKNFKLTFKENSIKGKNTHYSVNGFKTKMYIKNTKFTINTETDFDDIWYQLLSALDIYDDSEFNS